MTSASYWNAEEEEDDAHVRSVLQNMVSWRRQAHFMFNLPDSFLQRSAHLGLKTASFSISSKTHLA